MLELRKNKVRRGETALTFVCSVVFRYIYIYLMMTDKRVRMEHIALSKKTDYTDVELG